MLKSRLFKNTKYLLILSKIRGFNKRVESILKGLIRDYNVSINIDLTEKGELEINYVDYLLEEKNKYLNVYSNLPIYSDGNIKIVRSNINYEKFSAYKVLIRNFNLVLLLSKHYDKESNSFNYLLKVIIRQ